MIICTKPRCGEESAWKDVGRRAGNSFAFTSAIRLRQSLNGRPVGRIADQERSHDRLIQVSQPPAGRLRNGALMGRPQTEAWGISADLWPLPGGHRNAVCRTVGLGQDLVFKSTSRTPEALAWLLAVHDRARDAGFLAWLQESREGALCSDGWTCETFIASRPRRQESAADRQK